LRSTGLFAGGITAVLGGMAAVLIGSYFVASAAGRIDIFCDQPSIPCAYKNDATRMTGGAITMALGALIGAAGIPMWVIGGQHIIVPKGSQPSSWVPEVRVGPLSGSVVLSF
jgi:hypothetical protein